MGRRAVVSGPLAMAMLSAALFVFLLPVLSHGRELVQSEESTKVPSVDDALMFDALKLRRGLLEVVPTSWRCFP